MKIGYYAVFNYDEYDPTEEKWGISILFPDIPECNSCARCEKEGFAMAKDVLQLVTAYLYVHELPKASPLEKIVLSKNEKAFFISYNTEELNMEQFIVYD